MQPNESASWLEYVRYAWPRLRICGERSVSSQPVTRAPWMVMGKKRFELLKLLWSKKFLARVRKVSASKVQPHRGMVTPYWCSSSRSPCKGMKGLLVELSSAPEMVSNGGG